jgi:adenine nucleotide transporter 17
LMEIIQQQGFLGLYRGLESKLMQTCLNSALMFVTYENLVEFLTKLLHHDHGAS